ncbi:MAG: M6 family metalloprotease domain-containing protein, partial [Calditrichota bacterium]
MRRNFGGLLALGITFSVLSVFAMPARDGGPEPVYPAGVNQPSPARLNRDHPDLEGEWHCLVLLVDFSDYPWNNQADTLFPNEGLPYTQQHFQDMLFSEGEYAHPGAGSDYTGSMRDYYTEVSAGAFTVRGVVTRWYRAPHPYRYYCNADGEFGTEDDYGYRPYPENIQGLVTDVVRLADRDIDFSRYDNDGDDRVDALFLIHAGPGAEDFGRNEIGANYFWSHKWGIPGLICDSVVVGEYTTEPQNGTIGVFCHEFGHALGLPDLYDIDGSSEGVGEWCMMSAGGWNYRRGDPFGSSPAHFCGWSKLELEWVEVINIADSLENIAIPPIETDPVVYRLWVGGEDSPEFFLLENRRRIGFDSGLTRRQVEYNLPAPEGLLITHIDRTRRGWENNDNADDQHRLVDVEEASPVFIDGIPFEQLNRPRVRPEDRFLINPNRGDNGDLWPGWSNLTEDTQDYTGGRDRNRFGLNTIPSS